jgi:NADH-quinone oxidoreductase subunit C
MSDEIKPGEGAKPAEVAPAKPVPKPVVKKPTIMETVPWEGPLVDALKGRFGEKISLFGTYREQDFIEADISAAYEIVEFLKNEEAFDYLVDLTAVHWPKKEKPFEVVWILYSFAKNTRVRIKSSVADGEKAPSVVALHNTANWAEREVYDMYGVEFENHPDLKRILMPDEWEGFPLRKEYGMIEQDEAWVRENLKIESGQ